MKFLPENYCKSCSSHCNEQGPFSLHQYRKGEKITFLNCKNYMIFLLTGALRVCSEEIGVFDCHSGQIILLVENATYNIYTDEDCEILVLNFVRSFQVCEKMDIDDVREILGDYRYIYHSMTINEDMWILVKSIIKYIKDGIDCISIHNAKLLEMFVVCRFYYSKRKLLEFFVPILDKGMYFQSLVKANCPNAKSVEELANLCGYSLHSFKKVFKYHFKLSPYKWMLQQNRNKILTLLLDNNIPIKAIVAEFSFSSQSHLNRYCNRYLGGTSSQIRNGKGKELRDSQ